jgi:hypothetical protein
MRKRAMTGPIHPLPYQPPVVAIAPLPPDDGAEPSPSDPFNEDGDAPAELMRDLAGLPPEPEA